MNFKHYVVVVYATRAIPNLIEITVLISTKGPSNCKRTNIAQNIISGLRLSFAPSLIDLQKISTVRFWRNQVSVVMVPYNLELGIMSTFW